MEKTEQKHIPVLAKEVIEILNPKPGENYIDCTFGFGGHAQIILEKTDPKGKLLGIEWDEQYYKDSASKFKNLKQRLILVNDNYANLKKIVDKQKFSKVDGIILDVGISSWDIDESEKGFSFRKDEKLDMRFNTKNDITAKGIINNWNQEDLEKIFKYFGEERFYRQIARRIIQERDNKPITTTGQLTDIIARSIPGFAKRSPNFPSRIFQALRIAVNGELDNLSKVLPQAVELLKKDGELIVISFHSLEDRIVKNYFKELKANNTVQILTKKPLIATDQEIQNNPRSKPAKLRAIKKL